MRVGRQSAELVAEDEVLALDAGGSGIVFR